MVTFLTIPRELRNEIYHHYTARIFNTTAFEVFQPVTDFVCHKHEYQLCYAGKMARPKHDALAYTCRQIFTEYLEEQRRHKRQVIHSFAFRFRSNELEPFTPHCLNDSVREEVTDVRLYANISKAIATVPSREVLHKINKDIYKVGEDSHGNRIIERAAGTPLYICEEDIRHGEPFSYTVRGSKQYRMACSMVAKEFYKQVSRLLKFVYGFNAVQHLELRIRIQQKQSKFLEKWLFLEAVSEMLEWLREDIERLAKALPTLKLIVVVINDHIRRSDSFIPLHTSTGVIVYRA